MKLSQILCASLVAALTMPAQLLADDTDLYLNPELTQNRSKVLIIFDNSGSMDAEVEGAQKGYDPTITYPAVGSSNSYQGRMIYFTVGTGMDESSLPVPDSPSESRRFNELINGCAASKIALDKYGRFTGYIREFKFTGNGKGTWQQIKENSGAEKNNPVDCGEDIEEGTADNNKTLTGYEPGYPQDSVKSGNTYTPYGAVDSDAQDTAKAIGFGTGELVTLYTDNYLRWYTLYKGGLLPPDDTPPTRLEMAQSAITGVISSIPSVDFGLALFNLNYRDEGDRDGGRIVAGIKQRTSAEKDLLIGTVENIPAETNTPLCETLFEAYKYFSGGKITFGHSDSNYSNWYRANRPPYDSSIEADGSYKSPLTECSKIAYVIYITDGAPTVDTSANNFIKALNDAPYEYDTVRNRSSYLPALAGYMYNNDILPNTDNFQRVITHSIGFSLAEGSEAEPLLIETARRGGGKYFAANDTAQLQEKISNIVDEITKTGQRFSAPGVAFSNADPTRTLDSAYYALFRPSQSPKWAGNLKKLKVNSTGTLVDATGKPAIDSSGGISETACSFWSDCAGTPDGNDVILGGAARTISPDKRILYSDIGAGGAVTTLSLSNAALYAGGSISLATYMSLPLTDVSADLTKAFEWIKGNNVDKADDGEFTSEDFSGIRGDIVGDPLHSQPLAIDYGGDGSNVVIFFGTNHGMLHAFKDTGSSVSESWAFMPYQLLPNVTTLRGNNYAIGHSVYGMDGSPVAYLERNSSGAITKAWLFIGMRRGGETYFAFDVTDPSAKPKLLWKVSNSTDGFTDLGQTWSTPVVTRVLGSDKPVVIFGGGYNHGYDSGTGKNSDGRAVFIVDAETGSLVHKFGASGSTILSGIEDSIVGAIATLDSNSDGYTDRLYASDLGGKVWRMDMPSDDKSTWSGFKFADLGGTLSNDRRFFYEPIVAQTYFTNTTKVTVTDASGTTSTVSYQNVPYDAVTLGTGNRAEPLNRTTNDMFYVLQDRNVITQQFGSGGSPVPEAITFSNLYNVTSASPTTEAENIEFGTKKGWYYDFPVAGEKSLSPSIIIKGKVYFTSFIPTQPAADQDVCTVSSVGRLYTLDLHKGARYAEKYVIDVCDNCIPQPPKIITPPADKPIPCEGEDCPPPCEGEGCTNPPEPEPEPDCESQIKLIIGKGICDENGFNCTGTINLDACLNTNKLYYHQAENN